MEIVKLIRT